MTFLALALGLVLAGSSCSKHNHQDVVQTQQHKTIEVSISAQAFLEGGEELRALPVKLEEINGKLIPVPQFQDGEKIPVHTAIRNMDGSRFGIKTINWTYDGRTKTLRIAPEDGHKIEIKSYAGNGNTDTYFVSGIIGGTLVGEEVIFDHNPTAALDVKDWVSGTNLTEDLDITIPYVMDWTPANVNESDPSIFHMPTPNKFKPQGSILAYHIGNAMNRELTVQSFTVHGNLFVTAGKYSLQATEIAQNYKPIFTPSYCSSTYELANKPKLLKGDAPQVYYAWIMPTDKGRDQTTEPTSKAWTQVTLKGDSEISFKDYTHTYFTDYSPKDNTKLTDGRYYYLRANAHESVRLPFEYVAEYNLAGGDPQQGSFDFTNDAHPRDNRTTAELRFQNITPSGQEIENYYETYPSRASFSAGIYSSALLTGRVTDGNPSGATFSSLKLRDTDGQYITLGDKYHVPLQDEWWGTLLSFGQGAPNGSWSGGFHWTNFRNSPTGKTNEPMALGQEYSTTQGLRWLYSSEFAQTGANVIYGLRFAKPTDACTMGTRRRGRNHYG